MTAKNIVVVGAGLAGLTTAVRLVDVGHQVTGRRRYVRYSKPFVKAPQAYKAFKDKQELKVVLHP